MEVPITVCTFPREDQCRSVRFDERSVAILASRFRQAFLNAMPKVRECHLCCGPWNGRDNEGCTARCPARRGLRRRTVATQLRQGVVPVGLHPRSQLMQEALFAVATSQQDCSRALRKCADAIKYWDEELHHWEKENDRLRNLGSQLRAYQESEPEEEPIAPKLPPPPYEVRD